MPATTSSHAMMRLGKSNHNEKKTKNELTLSIFAKTMRKALWNYRSLLRKYLPYQERNIKMKELGLRDKKVSDEISLYQIGCRIVVDIENHFDPSKQGYYSYSGVESFGTFLKEFLNNYIITNNKVIHRTQKAAGALIQATQLLYSKKYPLIHSVESQQIKLESCNQFIARYGSPEQQDMYIRLLKEVIKLRDEEDTSFYEDLYEHFQDILETYRGEVNSAKPDTTPSNENGDKS